MEGKIIVTSLLIVFVFTFLLLIVLHFRVKRLIHNWANKHSYTITKIDHKIFWKGPFNWGSGRGQKVFFVTVKDSSNKTKDAYICCGNYWLGGFTNKLNVIWDEEYKRLK